MKKILSLMLSLIMTVSVLFAVPNDCFAATSSGWCGDDVYYEYNSSTGNLYLSGSGSTKDYSTFSVSPFKSMTGLKNVIIYDGITTLGSNIFNSCSNLTSVTIPSSITFVKSDAFVNCKNLNSVNINDIEAWCNIKFDSGDSNPTKYAKNIYLNGSLLTKLIIPSSITTINYAAFVNCTCLEKVTIPDSVTRITWQAFYGCRGIKELTIPCSTKIDNYMHTFANCSNIEKLTLTKGSGTMQNYSSTTGNSDTYYQYTPWYVSRNNLSTVIIEDGVNSIGDYAFYGCNNIKKLEMPCSTIIYNSENTFYDCSSIEIVNLTKGTGTMPLYSRSTESSNTCYQFTPWYVSRDSLKEINIERDVKSIPNYAFYGCTNNTDLYFRSPGCIIPSDTSVTGNAKIFGYDNSSAQDYAKKYSKEFSSIGKFDCKSSEHNYSATTVAKATTSKNGSVSICCKYCGNVKSKKTVYKISKETLSKTSYVYDGNAKKPSVTVKDSKGNTLKKDTDYTLSYLNNTEIGEATAKINFKGNYSGSIKKTFLIKPKATSLTSVSTPKKKTIVIKWTPISNLSGYEVQVSNDKNFSKSKTITYKAKKDSTKATLTNLISRKTYYFRIRAYKTVNGKTYYSAWSKVKSIKCK